MKTKKTKHVSIIYVICFVIVLSESLYASFNALISEVWIWILFFSVTVCLIYLFDKRLKDVLLSNFEAYLQQKIMQKDWPVEMTFPLKEHIESWISKYTRSIKGSLSYHIWVNNTEGKTFQRWVQILKNTFIPVIGVDGGISLFDLYYLNNSIDVSNADPNQTGSCYGLEATRALLEFMPVQDLVANLKVPIILNEQALYYLMIRDEKIGDFNEFCSALMETNREITTNMVVIEQLISETSAQVPIVFPKEFLAYLIKKKNEYLDRYYPHDREEIKDMRAKVFDWYTSQKKQDIDRKFFFCWPKFTQEEIPVIFKLFDEKVITDEIFLRHRLWKYLSVELLNTKMYTNTKDVSLLDEIAIRLRK